MHNVTNPRNDLSAEKARARFRYDARAGCLVAAADGRSVGWVHSTGYRYVNVGRVQYKEHRLIWLIVFGRWPTGQIDHINGNRADNHLDNLRDVTGSINQRNTGRRADNTSGYKGVVFNKSHGRYLARIGLHGKRRHLGYFATAAEAGSAYEAAALKLV